MQFLPNTLIGNRYQIITALPSENGLQRYQVMDTQKQHLVELLAPTAAQILEPRQKETFIAYHNSMTSSLPNFEGCLDVGMHGNIPFAIYHPVNSLFNPKHKLSTEQAVDLLNWAVPLILNNPQKFSEGLRYSDIAILEDNTVVFRPTGILNKDQKFQIDVLQHPQNHQNPLFALAMLVIQSQISLPPFAKRNHFLDWIEQFPDASQGLPKELHERLIPLLQKEYSQSFSPTFDQGVFSGKSPMKLLLPKELSIDAHSSSNHLNNASKHSTTTSMPSNNATQVSTQSKAIADVELPKYFVVVEKIPSQSAAKQLAAIADIAPNVLIAQMNETDLPLMGAKTQKEATQLLALFENVPADVKVLPITGIWAQNWMIWLNITILIAGLSGIFSFGYPAGIVAILGILFLGFQGFMANRSRSQFQKIWKSYQIVGIDDPKQIMNRGLQKVRRNILLSDLPLIAIHEYMDNIQELEIDNPTLEQANQIVQMAQQMTIQPSSPSASHQQNIDFQEKIRRLQQQHQNLD